VENKLSATSGVSNVHLEQSRGNKPPIQFRVQFQIQQRSRPMKIKNRQDFLWC